MLLKFICNVLRIPYMEQWIQLTKIALTPLHLMVVDKMVCGYLARPKHNKASAASTCILFWIVTLYKLSQWEETLYCNFVSYWLSACILQNCFGSNTSLKKINIVRAAGEMTSRQSSELSDFLGWVIKQGCCPEIKFMVIAKSLFSS